MKEQESKMILPSVDSLFMSQAERDMIDAEKVEYIDIDKIKEYNNVVFWSFDLNNYKKSNWWKRTATESVKDQITIRTANTMKKILELCNK